MSDTPKIPLAVPDLRGNEAKYLAQCVADNWVSSVGPFVTEMERRLAALSARRHAVATVNGTAALHLALLALGVGRGDLVVVPDWTFAATANAVVHAGATPLFVDVTEESWTLDATLLDRALADHKGRVKAAIVVHALGHPGDMDAIMPVAARHRVPVVEDAAGAIGASYKGRPVGSFGAAAIFSFNGNKVATAGGGGMVVADDDAIARTVRHLSTQARPGADYIHDAAGFNYRMTNLNAAVGLAQLERLDDMVAIKRRIAARYAEAVAGRADMSFMPRRAWAESSAWLSSVLVARADDAAALVDHLARSAIEARVFWRALSPQAPYRGAPRLLSGVAAALSGRVVSLPCSTSLSDADQGRVLDALAAWRGQALSRAA
jgi:dTDP-4-amino-4,6-dideoxygalactose transaminase